MTTRPDETAPRHPDLVKRGWRTPTGTDQLWVADFSYLWTLAGFVYVAYVVGVFSHRNLGWRVTTTKHTSMVTDALRQALQVRRRGDNAWAPAGLVHHSDAGSQYVSVAFTAELLDAGIAGSIGTLGDGLDNALADQVQKPRRAVSSPPDRPPQVRSGHRPARRHAHDLRPPQADATQLTRTLST